LLLQNTPDKSPLACEQPKSCRGREKQLRDGSTAIGKPGFYSGATHLPPWIRFFSLWRHFFRCGQDFSRRGGIFSIVDKISGVGVALFSLWRVGWRWGG